MKVYFTFGTDIRFPYPETEYVVAEADTRAEAIKKFMRKHPNPRPGHENLINCAFTYTEEQWNKSCRQYYGDREPIQVIK